MAKKFKEYHKINEKGVAYAGAGSGMGAVVTPTPSTVPGATITGNGTTGSGDIAAGATIPGVVYTKREAGKKKDKKKGVKKFSDLIKFEDYNLPEEDKNYTWEDKHGVTVFILKDTQYTLYKSVLDNEIYELYKFDDDYGPLIMRFRFEDDKFIFMYGGFEDDLFSNTYSDDILEMIFDYFKIESEGKGFKNSNIEFRN